MISYERREIFEIDATPVCNVMSGEEQKSNNTTFRDRVNVTGGRLYRRLHQASSQPGFLRMILADCVPYASRDFASIVVLPKVRRELCHLVVVVEDTPPTVPTLSTQPHSMKKLSRIRREVSADPINGLWTMR